MNQTQAEIERIVREVLHRLQSGDAAPRAAAQSSAPSAAPAADRSVLALRQRLVTQADFEGRLDGVRSVRVPPRAIVTPAARDYLRERGIVLSCEEASSGTPPVIASSNKNLSGSVRRLSSLHLGLADTRFDPRDLLQLLAKQAVEVARLPEGAFAAVVDATAQRAAAGGLAVLLTGRPAAALCLANRIGRVRAAWGQDLAMLEGALRDVGANLLVVDPQGPSLHQLKHILVRFAGEAQACPAELAARLG